MCVFYKLLKPKTVLPGSSLMKIVYRSNKDFRDGNPISNDVRILYLKKFF